jgi:cytochrome c biogenesis protein CcmG/thiol:disulfide interchange protein DsbE
LLGKPLPSFKRPTLGQGEFDVDAVRGRIVVVKFFAEYCIPCQRTLPSAEQLYREQGDLAFVGVSEDERASDAEGQVKRYGLSFPVVVDRGNVLAGKFRVRELPVVFVGDRQGKVVWVGGPAQKEDDLRAAIEAVRAGE